jgi:hypothetical protein
MVLLEKEMKAYAQLPIAQDLKKQYTKYVNGQNAIKAERGRCMQIVANWRVKHPKQVPKSRNSRYWKALRYVLAHPLGSFEVEQRKEWMARAEANAALLNDPAVTFQPVDAADRRRLRTAAPAPSETGVEAPRLPTVEEQVPHGEGILEFDEDDLRQNTPEEDTLDVAELSLGDSQKERDAVAKAEPECVGKGFPLNDKAWQKMRSIWSFWTFSSPEHGE